MALVGFAESSHPELEQPDIVLLARPSGTKEGQNLLGILPPSPVHFGELEQHFDFTEIERINYEKAFVCKVVKSYLNPGGLHINNAFYSLHPLFLQTQQAVRYNVHRQVLVRQGHLQLVQ